MIKDGEGQAVQGGVINFASFILSLSTSAMVHLGLIKNPLTKNREEDIEVARQEIHIIEMLKEKTKGNLSDDEKRLIDDALFHLHTVFVEKVKK